MKIRQMSLSILFFFHVLFSLDPCKLVFRDIARRDAYVNMRASKLVINNFVPHWKINSRREMWNPKYVKHLLYKKTIYLSGGFSTSGYSQASLIVVKCPFIQHLLNKAGNSNVPMRSRISCELFNKKDWVKVIFAESQIRLTGEVGPVGHKRDLIDLRNDQLTIKFFSWRFDIRHRLVVHSIKGKFCINKWQQNALINCVYYL